MCGRHIFGHVACLFPGTTMGTRSADCEANPFVYANIMKMVYGFSSSSLLGSNLLRLSSIRAISIQSGPRVPMPKTGFSFIKTLFYKQTSFYIIKGTYDCETYPIYFHYFLGGKFTSTIFGVYRPFWNTSYKIQMAHISVIGKTFKKSEKINCKFKHLW